MPKKKEEKLEKSEEVVEKESPVQKLTEEEPETAAEKPEEAENETNSEESSEMQVNDNEDKENVSEDSVASNELIIDEDTSGMKKGFNKKIILVVMAVALIVALVSGGIMVYRKAMVGKDNDQPSAETPSAETPTQTAEEEASPSTSLKREDLKIKILNGSGIAGLAGKAKDYLVGLGYKDIETSNADNYDYKETEISLKDERKDYLEMLSKDLAEKYVLASESSSLKDSEFDVEITLGSQFKEEESAESTESAEEE